MSRTFPVFVAILATLFCVNSYAAALSPTPQPGNSQFSQSYFSTTNASAALAANGVTCAAPGGASCTVVLAALDMSGWAGATFYLRNSGVNPVEDILFEVSGDGTYWTNIAQVSIKASNLAASGRRVVSYSGSYRYVRIEARSNAGSTLQVGVTSMRPDQGAQWAVDGLAVTTNKTLADVFGRQSGPCVKLDLTVANASVALPAGRYRVVCLSNSGCFFRQGAAAVVTGEAERLATDQSVIITPTVDTTLQAILPAGSPAASPGIQACPRAE